MSTFDDADRAPLHGHYYRLPAGTPLPEGLAVVADGQAIRSDSPHPERHCSICPIVAMTPDTFIQLVTGLPWSYVGRKP